MGRAELDEHSLLLVTWEARPDAYGYTAWEQTTDRIPFDSLFKPTYGCGFDLPSYANTQGHL